MINKINLILFLIVFFNYSFSQNIYNIEDQNGQVITTCSGKFVDSGNVTQNYSDDESYTITFCPNTPGDLISINFSDFETEVIGATAYDYLDYWNGNSINGTPDGTFAGNLGAFSYTSSSLDGCITFQFTSDFTINRSGWEAEISCATPCSPPTATLVDNTTLEICNPSSITSDSLTINFDGSASVAVGSSNITSYEWDFGDGTTEITTQATTTHTYPNDSGIYIANLTVRDDNFTLDPMGCVSTNATSKIIKILPEPNFINTPIVYDVVCGESVILNGIISSQTETQNPPTFTPGITELPDGSGVSYESSLDFTNVFTSGATITSDCYPILTFDLEHSWSTDLEIELIAPTGESVMIFDKHASGDSSSKSLFGTCVNDDDSTPIIPGCTENYIVVGDNTGILWTDTGNTTTESVSCDIYSGVCEPGEYYLPLTYESTEPFSNFDGGDLNGIWTLRITDTFILDNGVLNDWSITFPDECYSLLETVTPELVSAEWSHQGNGPAIPSQSTSSTIITNPGPDLCPASQNCDGTELTNNIEIGPFLTIGNYVYTITVQDEFGCEFSKDIVVNSTCNNCTLNLETANNNQSVCYNNAINDITYSVSESVTDVILEGDLPEGITGVYDEINATFTISGTSTSLTNTIYTYTLNTVGCSTSEIISGTIEYKTCQISKGISPNGDGINDTWDLSGFDIKKVQVFDRYGNKLYSKNNYTNEWDGTANGFDLPTGAYYYVITFNNNTNKTGWVYINK
jgi:gliding motility-associated-like protein